MVSIISYNKQTWNEYNDSQTADKNLANGAIISADRLNHMETGISNNDTNKVTDNKNGSITVNGATFVPADDNKVVHLSGANNFDTVPTVNNNPLLLASSLPSGLARTGSDQEFTGKNTFDTAPIDKATGNPYITKSDVPVIKVVTQAEYNALTDKTGLYVIQG